MRGQSLLQRLFIMVVVGLLLLPGLADAATRGTASETFTEGELHVKIDGLDIEFDPAPYVLPPGRTMVPMRAFFEALGATVSWDATSRAVTGVRGGLTVQLTIGSQIASVNGAERRIDVAPEIRHDRTFIPLRFVSEVLGGTVTYNSLLKEVSISSNPTKLGTLRVEKGMKVHFRLMLINLFLHNRWSTVVESAEPFPGPITYTLEGNFAGASMTLIRRTLSHLSDSRKFLPVVIAPDEEETAPWVSAKVYDELKTHGKTEGFLMGGFSVSGQKETTLTLTGRTMVAFTMEGKRIQVPAVLAETPSGDRLWILDDGANPLVLKFQPVGLPLPGGQGTLGYQVEWIGTN